MKKTDGGPKRGAIWCDREDAALVTQVAQLMGMTAREYVRDELAPVVQAQMVEVVSALHAQLPAVGGEGSDNGSK